MVGSVSPIGAESSQALGVIPGSQSGPAASSSRSSGLTSDSLSGASVLGNSQALAQVFRAVSDLLGEIEGRAENDKVLQALIALLILMTLLQRMADPSESGGSLLGGSSGPAGANPIVTASSHSSSTISIEQTSVTNVYELSAGSASAYDLGQVNSTGNTIDLQT